MIGENLDSLLVGSMFGKGSFAESQIPAQALPGGGTSVSPSGQQSAINRKAQGAGEWGSKMPLNKIPKAEQKIEAAKDATKAEETFLGLTPTVWKEVFIYGGLAVLFFIGVVSLLTGSGLSVNSVQAGVKKIAKVGT